MIASGAGDSPCRGANCQARSYGFNRRMIFDLLPGGEGAERSELYLDTVQSYPEFFAQPDAAECNFG